MEDSYASGGHSPKPNTGTQTDKCVGGGQGQGSRFAVKHVVAMTMILCFLSLAFLVSLHACGAHSSQEVSVKICLAFCLQEIKGSGVCSLYLLLISCPFALSGLTLSSLTLSQVSWPRPRISPPQPGEGKTAPISSLEAHPGEQRGLSLDSWQPPWL